ncbi:hypothetical protein BASA50_002131 [Batrachochytrium salamandrivorans]|uniref:15-cis-phytoene synthase n=1 Tax=Batrachochytrium salamandrivorans TaxID=1357716 RepID=A0ABQ8FLZ6_9FUNG|nr:hypothetical protein BASA60_008143 [Batrachochytrium salamandrivorans]KAH6575086.1 hypothetical protein BASA62_002123 [Batrachochytrium salamandrivorans]KAH6584822.1 hypothetical protein BASA61_007190 [Batrachochytrium salamandrivorans]KAH6600567.1 hypothetical protein BASA50_002131 [Batrachochytrium salamandrivorans]KAH9255948.1 hypothetical protein BASA81_005984 [Batrachochytrium salamandrivorans]
MLSLRNAGARRCKIGVYRGPAGAMQLNTRRCLSDCPAEKYCMDLVRSHDYEQFLATLFVSAPARPAAWAIKAFNVETALIRDVVSQANIREMRIQWWRDAIDRTFQGSPPNHPITKTLAKTLEKTRLSKMWFTKILSARESNMKDTQYNTMTDLEAYAENTVSSLIYLQLEALGISDLNAEHAASHSGKAIGIATALRGTPFNVSKRRFYLPAEIMSQHSVVTEEIFRFGPNEKLADAIFTIATRANDQLLTARTFSKDVPKEATATLLPLVIAHNYLTNLEKANFNVFDPALQKRSLWLQFHLWKKFYSHKY